MSDRGLNKFMNRLRGFLPKQDAASMTDADLLQRFIQQRDNAAFEALVRKHGPMVLGVCWRVLRNRHDAEDAFQATFLVLVSKATTLRSPGMIGNWLYGVAHRTALHAKDAAIKRRAKEAQAVARTETTENTGVELRSLLDGELQRLPDKYRAVIVLCELEGKTRKEAAEYLGWAEGTVASRLARGRFMLAKKLARHGLLLSSESLGIVLAQNELSACMPGSLQTSAVYAASLFAAGHEGAGLISVKTTVLMEGVLRMMLFSKLKTAAFTLLTIGVVGLIASVIPLHILADQKTAQSPPAPATPIDKPAESVKKPEFRNAIGWSWLESPRPRQEFGVSLSQANILGTGFSAIFEEDKVHALIIYMAFNPNQAALDYRPVAFDSEGKRTPLKSVGGGGHHNTRLVRYRLDPKELTIDNAAYLGIEILPSAGRKLVAADAFERAKKAGIEVLPPAEMGSEFRFALTTMDGRKIDSNDLRGKVVLIDCWATWCVPCMSKMPELKQLYEKHHKNGLEVVGVSLDYDINKAKNAITSKNLNWLHVYVPADEKTRELWSESAGIGSLPRLLLLDRQGILRAEGGTAILDDQLEKLLNPQSN